MRTVLFPAKSEWNALCSRAVIENEDIDEIVSNILHDVRQNGDSALLAYAKKFDNADLQTLQVSENELIESENLLAQDLKQAIAVAARNIEKFHASQKITEPVVETAAGIKCWRQSAAIERIGLYVPGGSAPLFSTVLMLGIPAKIAGCTQVALCTPASKNGNINHAILYAAKMVGIKKIFKAGGAQAIAAMAYGTQSVPKVDKIFGPGNRFVTCAKALVQRAGVAIDMPAGPSEVLVIADGSQNAAFAAADLLAQAEHGADSQAILLTTCENFAQEVEKQIHCQLAALPRMDIAVKALKYSRLIVLHTLDECFEFSNHYAPEHLIVALDDAENYAQKITAAGSVFLGKYACETLGDYASGTNHTLPTNGYAASYSGVSLDSFVKKITFQNVCKNGLKNIGKTIEIMAAAEGLQAHKNAVSMRLKNL
jgi:histidinol dehydrogenase